RVGALLGAGAHARFDERGEALEPGEARAGVGLLIAMLEQVDRQRRGAYARIARRPVTFGGRTLRREPGLRALPAPGAAVEERQVHAELQLILAEIGERRVIGP